MAEKMSALITEQYLKERSDQGSKKKFLSALSKVPDEDPVPEDKN